MKFWKNLDSSIKRLIIIAISLIALLIIFFVVASIIIGKNESYEKIEERLLNAAISYYGKNKELLPKQDGNEVSIDAAELVSEGYLKEFEKYNKQEGPNCNGQVFVVNNNGHYLYMPNLVCSKYKTTTLTNKILSQQKVVTEGNGLYQVGNEYVYRGEFVNNYVMFASQMWRILKIDSGGYIKLLQEVSKTQSPFDDRYNIKIDREYGINNYEVSRAKEALNAFYNDNEIFTDEDRSKIASQNLCIGKRTGNEKVNDGSLECKTMTKEKYPLGLIQLNEAINPSIDANCKTPLSTSCSNYNYLNDVFGNAWTLTANSKNTYEAFSVFAPDITRCSRGKKLHATLYLSNRLMYTSGTGTEEDPYVIG